MRMYFIGIGGIGLSGIAAIYKQKGNYVQGSDAEESEITRDLRKQGIPVFVGHKKENMSIGVRPMSDPSVPDLKIEKVVYSEAVPESNPELKEARRLKISCLSGAEALAQLSQAYFTIAVSGMHGKSTTASMLAQVLIKVGLDPTFVIGTKPGFRLGKSRYLVIEADDYQAKFLHYHPDILVLTNIEEEHMDYFQNLNHILRVFQQYAGQVKESIVANRDDRNVVQVLKNLKSPRRSPACGGTLRGRQNSNHKITTKNLKLTAKSPKIVFYSLRQKENRTLQKILKVPGRHNVSNALAVLQTARTLGIDDKITLQALSEYKGVWRRFQQEKLEIGNWKLEIIQDYAHHPTEIQATLQAAKERFPGRKIWVVFQPHQYQRTFYLFKDFVNVFQKNPLAHLIITDIYSVKGRESQAIKKKVNARKLVKAINRKWVLYLPKEKITSYLLASLKKGTVLMIMGAGDIYKLPDVLVGKQRHL